MTQTSAPLESRAADLPPWWWARGTTLSERLADPEPGSVPGRTAGRRLDALRAAPCGSAADGLALRLTALGLGDDLVERLGREEPRRLAARRAKPRWAGAAEQILREAPEHPGADCRGAQAGGAAESGDDAGAEVFRPALRPLLEFAQARLTPRLSLPDAEQPVVCAAFTRYLGGRLTRLAARTLVRELHRFGGEGRLSGTGPRERFDSFTAQMGTRAGLAELFGRYPVLARMLSQTCLDAVEAGAQFAGRLAQDRQDLTARLFDGTDPGPLAGLVLGCGDVHQGGQSVAVLSFATGRKAVYKPRPVDQHALLAELAAWLRTHVPDLALRTPRHLCRPGHGWVEFIEHHRCDSIAQADRFYRRHGALLALLYAVDGADMHFENVIACGDQPVPVDVETLLHGGLPPATIAGEDPAAEALQASVYRTCLLPTLLIGEDGALDISAIGRVDSGVAPSTRLRWADAGTDRMRAVRVLCAIPAAANQPSPGGVRNATADHRSALFAGFRAAYDAIVAHRAELLAADGAPCRFADRPARLIARATRLYATLLDESTHPDLLEDALARDAVFATLWTESAHDPARARLVEYEIADLWRGDVPLFTHRPDRTAVWTSGGTGLDEVLPQPALDAVRRKIGAMGEVDRHDQEWVIAAALAVAGDGSRPGAARSRLVAQPVPAAVPTTRGRLLAAACGIADEVVARAIHGRDRSNWVGLERITGDHWAVQPMGAGLGQGYTGVAVFLAQIGRLTGARRYTDLAVAALRPLPALLRALTLDAELSRVVGPGALDGIGGIVHASIRLRDLLDLEAELGVPGGECLGLALTALEHTLPGGSEDAGGAADRAGATGLASGLAGALSAALAAEAAGGSPAAAGIADRAARALLDLLSTGPRPHPPVPGFAEGDAGTGWALLGYADAREGRTDAARCREAGIRLLRPGIDAVAGERADAFAAAEHDATWYSGVPGVVAAGLRLGPLPDETGLVKALDWCVGALAERDLSLGEGAMGAMEGLALLAEHGVAAACEPLALRGADLLGRVEVLGPHCATPDHVPSPGLLTGLSGVGYGLLRLSYPDRVPALIL